jgi:hypothetical protein
MSTRRFQAVSTLVLLSMGMTTSSWPAAPHEKRPNILFAIADDWSWPHAGAYGDAVVETPAFDRLAREGALFRHAYVSSPSCTPSRGAILTGQWHWRLEAGGNLWSVFPDKFATYPEILRKAGYDVGVTGKGWGPGRTETPGRQLAGKPYPDFQAFLEARQPTKPFCFWLGSSDPHRPYQRGVGVASGMDVDKVQLFGCFPDSPEIRSDVADYYFEVQRFDSLVRDTMEGSILICLDRYKEARRLVEPLLDVVPLPATVTLWHIEWHEGSKDRAFELGQRFLSMYPHTARCLEALEQGWQAGGYEEATRRAAEALGQEVDVPDSYVPPTLIARLHLHAGQHDEALKWLHRGYEGGDPGLVHVTGPPWTRLQSEPEYARLLERMRLGP